MRKRSCSLVQATLVACGTMGLLASLASAQAVPTKRPQQAEPVAHQQAPGQNHQQTPVRVKQVDRKLVKGQPVFDAATEKKLSVAQDVRANARLNVAQSNPTTGQQRIEGVAVRGPGGFLTTCEPVPWPVGNPEGTYFFDTSASSASGHTATCNPSGTIDMWMSYTPTSTGLATVTTCGGSSDDTILSVYTDCPIEFGGVELYCNDDDCSLQSTIQFPVSAGDFYVIRISGHFGATVSGSMTISVDAGDPPANDDCDVNSPEVFVGSPVSGTTVGATNSWTSSNPGVCGGAIPGSGGLNDVWYRFTAPADDSYIFSLCGSSYDTQISVFSGCPADFDDSLRITCNDDACGLQSQTNPIAMTTGQQVYVRVAGYNGASGNFILNVFATGILPTGDDCGDPWIAVDGENPFDTTGFTTSVTGCTGSNDGWFAYTATSTGSISATTCGLAGFDTTLGVYAACGDALSLIVCNDDACGLQSRVIWDASSGTTYYIRIAGLSGATGAGSVLIEALVPPENDQCAADSPEIFLDSPIFGTTLGAVTDIVGFPAACSPFGSEGVNDVFYRFTAPADGCYDISTCGSPDDTHLVVTDGCFGNVLGCNDDACGLQSTVGGLTLTSGQTVWIRVAAWAAADAGPFTLVVTNTPTPVQCTTCPGNATVIEVEPECGLGVSDDVNGGCNSFNNPGVAIPVSLGDVICGTGAIDYTVGLRDTDWYRFSVSDVTEVRLSVHAEFTVQFGLVNDDGCIAPAFLAVATSNPCIEGSVSAVLNPGTYFVFISAAQNSPEQKCENCGGAVGGNRYVATIEVPAPFGGCCVAGDCSVQTEADCLAAGGSYLGDNSNCTGSDPYTVSVSPGIAIPDNTPAGITSTLTGTGGIITDLNVGIHLTHTWQGDIAATLTHVNSGITVTLIDRPNVPQTTFGFGNDNYGTAESPFILDDSAALIYDAPVTPVDNVSGAWLPDTGPLSAFNGLSADSDWILTVSDNANGDTGTLVSWGLFINPSGGPCSGPAFCDADWCQDGSVGVPDIFCFLSDWFAMDPDARNYGGTPGVPAIFAFLSVWFSTGQGPCTP